VAQAIHQHQVAHQGNAHRDHDEGVEGRVRTGGDADDGPRMAARCILSSAARSIAAKRVRIEPTRTISARSSARSTTLPGRRAFPVSHRQTLFNIVKLLNKWMELCQARA